MSNNVASLKSMNKNLLLSQLCVWVLWVENVLKTSGQINTHRNSLYVCFWLCLWLRNNERMNIENLPSVGNARWRFKTILFAHFKLLLGAGLVVFTLPTYCSKIQMDSQIKCVIVLICVSRAWLQATSHCIGATPTTYQTSMEARFSSHNSLWIRFSWISSHIQHWGHLEEWY